MIKEDKVSVCAFPEGYTSKDGKLHPFRPGVFKIAQKTNVPIVVCTIQNTREIFKNLKHLRHTDVELHLVDIIPPESYAGLNTAFRHIPASACPLSGAYTASSACSRSHCI